MPALRSVIAALTLIFITAFTATTTEAVAGRMFSQDGGTVTAKANTSRVIRRIFNCKLGVVGGVSGMADHGTITVKDGTSNICNNPQQPTVFVTYTPNPGFVGTDHATLYFGGAPLMMDIVVQ